MLNEIELRVLKRINSGTNYPDELRDIFGGQYGYQCRRLVKKGLIHRENKSYLITEEGKKEIAKSNL